MIFEVKCDEERTNELTDRTHTHIVSFIVLDILSSCSDSVTSCPVLVLAVAPWSRVMKPAALHHQGWSLVSSLVTPRSECAKAACAISSQGHAIYTQPYTGDHRCQAAPVVTCWAATRSPGPLLFCCVARLDTSHITHGTGRHTPCQECEYRAVLCCAVL